MDHNRVGYMRPREPLCWARSVAAALKLTEQVRSVRQMAGGGERMC
jgi:hypothetical protein